jgi:hypothetical protein
MGAYIWGGFLTSQIEVGSSMNFHEKVSSQPTAVECTLDQLATARDL